MNKKIGLLGNKISYSVSPIFHNIWLKYFNINCNYEILDLKEDELTLNKLTLLVNNGYIGFNVTIPYKEIILSYINKVDNIVKVLNATNTIYLENNKFCADNTDYFGFLGSLILNRYNNLDLDNINTNNFLKLFKKNENALVIGAGGASKAIVYALIKSNIGKIYIINRNINKASLLKNIFNNNKIIIIEDINQIKNVSLIVNCTPKVNTTLLKYKFNLLVNNNCLFYDLNYKPLNTLFIKQAKENGFNTMNGLLMLILQGALSFKRWFNVFPPIDNSLLKMLEERLSNS